MPALRSGYVEAVDAEGLLALACRLQRVVRLEAGVGDFVAQAAPLASVAGTATLDRRDREGLLACVQVGTQRTVQQDAGFGLQQMVDVALRALSPGVNDPTTACMCIDQLSALLARLGARDIPGPFRMQDGALRVVVPTPDFAGWIGATLLPIVLHAGGDLSVLQRLVAALELLAAATRDWPSRRRALRPVVRQLQQAVVALRSRRAARPLHGRLRVVERALDAGVRR